MKKNIIVNPSKEDLAKYFAEILFNKINLLIGKKTKINLVLSGGNTPKLFYRVFAEYYAQKIEWEFVHIYWGDERCVPPEQTESNFKMAKEALLDYISIPKTNIHRIRGENDPYTEAERYSEEILTTVEVKNGLPSFDIFLLGLGEDGHTASIFPNQMNLLNSKNICETSVHPVTKQKRITITGRVINNSDEVIFLVTGKLKAEVVKKIINNEKSAESFPANYIYSINGFTEWFMDNDAASLINLSIK